MVSKDDVNVDKPGIGKNILQAPVHPRRNHTAVAGIAGRRCGPHPAALWAVTARRQNVMLHPNSVRTSCMGTAIWYVGRRASLPGTDEESGRTGADYDAGTITKYMAAQVQMHMHGRVEIQGA
jgi:hypothetical protein